MTRERHLFPLEANLFCRSARGHQGLKCCRLSMEIITAFLNAASGKIQILPVCEQLLLLFRLCGWLLCSLCALEPSAQDFPSQQTGGPGWEGFAEVALPPGPPLSSTSNLFPFVLGRSTFSLSLPNQSL